MRLTPRPSLLVLCGPIGCTSWGYRLLRDCGIMEVRGQVAMPAG